MPNYSILVADGKEKVRIYPEEMEKLSTERPKPFEKCSLKIDCFPGLFCYNATVIFDSDTLAQSNAQERRQYPRFGFSQPVKCGFTHSSSVEGALSADLSENGIRLAVKDFIALGTHVIINVIVAGKQLECQTKVVWVEKQRHSEWYQIGLEFLLVDSAVISRQWIGQSLHH